MRNGVAIHNPRPKAAEATSKLALWAQTLSLRAFRFTKNGYQKFFNVRSRDLSNNPSRTDPFPFPLTFMPKNFTIVVKEATFTPMPNTGKRDDREKGFR